MHCKFFLELERRPLKEATGRTCSDQHVHSPLTFAFIEEQSNRAHGSYMQCRSNLSVDSNLLALQVFFGVAEETSRRATGRTCSDSNCNPSCRKESGRATGRTCDDTDIHY